MTDQEHEQHAQGLERHVQTIVVMLTLGTIAWTGSTLWSMRDTMTRLEERVTALQSVVSDANNDRIRRTDWLGERQRIDERINGLDKRVDRLERPPKP